MLREIPIIEIGLVSQHHIVPVAIIFIVSVQKTEESKASVNIFNVILYCT